MPEDIIKRVETLAPPSQAEVVFGNRNGEIDKEQWQEQGDPQEEYFDANAYEFENEADISHEADDKIIDNQELQDIRNEDPGVDDRANANSGVGIEPGNDDLEVMVEDKEHQGVQEDAQIQMVHQQTMVMKRQVRKMTMKRSQTVLIQSQEVADKSRSERTYMITMSSPSISHLAHRHHQYGKPLESIPKVLELSHQQMMQCCNMPSLNILLNKG
jgi:hypothetical protein